MSYAMTESEVLTETWCIFGAGFRRASRFGADKILAILCRANSPDVTKDLCKVLLGLEAARHVLAHREHATSL
jgi:hypothetical protein